MADFRALILAGTRPGGDPLAGTEGKSNKALLELEGQSLLERVVIALRQGGACDIAVSCNDPAVEAEARRLGARTIGTASGPSQSVLMAFEAMGAPLLITTADNALLRGEWVWHMVEATPSDCDLSVMLARREDIENAMPGSKRTYLRFADGHWSGCNLFYLKTADARAAIETWREIEADRKRPWRIASRLGLRTLLNYAIGRLTLAEGLARLGRRVGVRAALVPAISGLAAVDVDTPKDLADIRRFLQSPDKRDGR